MRKIASIFLLGTLLFNWFGYRLAIDFWQEHEKNVLEARLDANDYDETQLICIKIPVTHLAYYNNSPEFKRVNGNVEINGVEYKYVKRRLYNDTLEWLCLPDQRAMTLRACANKIFGLPFKSFAADPHVLSTGSVAPAPFVAISTEYGDGSFFISPITPGANEQPPDEMA